MKWEIAMGGAVDDVSSLYPLTALVVLLALVWLLGQWIKRAGGKP